MSIKKTLKKMDKALDEVVESCSFQCQDFEHSQAIDDVVKIFEKLKLDIVKLQKDNEDLKDYYEGIDRERKMELSALKQNYDIATQPPMIHNIRGTAE